MVTVELAERNRNLYHSKKPAAFLADTKCQPTILDLGNQGSGSVHIQDASLLYIVWVDCPPPRIPVANEGLQFTGIPY